MSKQENHGNGSFIFGLILGAVIGAVIAILIYRNDKDKTIKKLKSTLEGWFAKIFPKDNPPPKTRSTKRKLIAKKESNSLPKIEVELPPILSSAAGNVPTPPAKKPRVFKRR